MLWVSGSEISWHFFLSGFLIFCSIKNTLANTHLSTTLCLLLYPPHRQYTSLDSKCSCCIEVWGIICYWESSAISARDLAKYKLQAESVLCGWMLPQSLQSKSERGESKYKRESGRFQCPRALSERRAGPLPIHTYLFHSNVLTWAAHTNIFQATRNANKRLQRSYSSLHLFIMNRGLKCTKTNMKHRDFHIWICVARCQEMQLSNDNIKVRGWFFLVVNLFSSYLQHFFQTNIQN